MSMVYPYLIVAVVFVAGVVVGVLVTREYYAEQRAALDADWAAVHAAQRIRQAATVAQQRVRQVAKYSNNRNWTV
jgi:uncharacterized membrane protein